MWCRRPGQYKTQRPLLMTTRWFRNQNQSKYNYDKVEGELGGRGERGAEKKRSKVMWVGGGVRWWWWYERIAVTVQLRLRCFLSYLIFLGVVQVDLVNCYGYESRLLFLHLWDNYQIIKGILFTVPGKEKLHYIENIIREPTSSCRNAERWRWGKNTFI